MSPFDHPWDVTPQEAIAIQQRLRHEIVLAGPPHPIRLVAGVDVGFEDEERITCAAVAVLRLPDLTLVAQAVVRRPTRFPYVPGLLSFRETAAVLDAIAELDTVPDLLLCDGQGYAHPRRFGMACHLGLLTGIPSIGVGKTWLIGQHVAPPDERGAWSPLEEGGDWLGAALRTRPGSKPLYVSPGHLVSQEATPGLVMACMGRYRLPETTRQAHRLASGR